MEKQLFQSLTIQGALVSLLGSVAARYGIPIENKELADIITLIVQLGGFVMVVVGRIRAKHALKLGSRVL